MGNAPPLIHADFILGAVGETVPLDVKPSLEAVERSISGKTILLSTCAPSITLLTLFPPF